MNIRTLSLADKFNYLKLIHAAYQETTALGINFPAASSDIQQITEHFNCNGVYGIVNQQNELISTVSLRFPWGNNPGPLVLPHIGWFATDPKYKRQGFAKILLDWLEENILLKQLKAPAVTLGTAANHSWLANFYRKHGFIEIGRKDLTPDHTTIYFKKVLVTNNSNHKIEQ